MTPCRVADTRTATGPFGAPELAANSTREFNIPQSACAISPTAVAYSLNVTVVPNAGLGYLTVWPAGESQPLVSTLNSDGRVKANATITPAGTNGAISVYATNATQFILDIDGYFVPAGTTSGLEFYPVTPCRVADTRNADGPLGGPAMGGNSSRAFPVQSSTCGIPSTAKAYSLNVTAVPHGGLGYLSSWPTGESQPLVSTLNASTGAVTANAAIVPAGTNGDVSIFVSSAADVVLDINGYFAPPANGGLSLYTVTPCRALDTRDGAGAFNGVLAVNIEGSVCAPSSTAQAYLLNATVVPPAGLGYLTLWPTGEGQPTVSTLNASDGAVTSNMAIVPTNNGSINAFSSNSTNLILDISSYFAPSISGPAAVTPGQTLNISGNFGTDATLTTTVLFSDNNGYQVSVLPQSVTSGTVSVSVPPYLNTQSGTITSGGVSVSVVQQPASGQGTTTAPVNLQVGALPQTGVAPGLITLDIMTQLSQLAGTANQTWSTIATESGGIVNASQLNLSTLQSNLIAAQADVQALVSGTVTQVSVGQINGQNVYLDINSLALMDQVLYAYYLGSTSPPVQLDAAVSGGVVRSVSTHPLEEDDNLLTNIDSWFLQEITSTLPQTIASNSSQLRGAASAGISLAVLIAAPAEVALASAAAVGGVVWMATTWATAATTAALEGAGSDILDQQPANVTAFSTTMSIIGNSYFELLLDKLEDIVAATGGEAGETAKTIVDTVMDIDQAVDPDNPEGVTAETQTAASQNLFNTGTHPFNGAWVGSYSYPSQLCPGQTQSGQLVFYITQSSPTSFSGSASLTGLKFFNTSDCSVVGTVDSSSGTVSGTVGSNGSLSTTASFTLDVSSIPDPADNSETFSMQGTLSNSTMSGSLNGGTFNLSF